MHVIVGDTALKEGLRSFELSKGQELSSLRGAGREAQ
jgi:hypothetical protein